MKQTRLKDRLTKLMVTVIVSSIPLRLFLYLFGLQLTFIVHLLVLAGCLVQSAKDIMKECAARLAVDVVTVASFPEFPQVSCILHNLLVHSSKITCIRVGF